MCSGSEAEVHGDKDESSGLRRLLHRLDQMTHQLEQNDVSLHAIRTKLDRLVALVTSFSGVDLQKWLPGLLSSSDRHEQGRARARRGNAFM